MARSRCLALVLSHFRRAIRQGIQDGKYAVQPSTAGDIDLGLPLHFLCLYFLIFVDANRVEAGPFGGA